MVSELTPGGDSRLKLSSRGELDEKCITDDRLAVNVALPSARAPASKIRESQ